jgi:membrane-associated phospholipid phosphatase
LVTFPSFHTTLALVIAYCGARLRFVGAPVVVLNLLVVASTMAEGGHYFADIAGGAVIAFAAIGLVRLVNAGAATRDPVIAVGAAGA